MAQNPIARTRIAFIAALTSLLLCAGAQAALIDFTDHDDWGDAAGSASFSQTTDDGINVTLDSTGGTMTTNAGGDAAGCANNGGGALLACDGDGIGVGDDEVSYGSQSITVTFDTAIDIVAVHLLDLFWRGSDLETARITANGIDTIDLIGSAGTDDDGGFFTQLVNWTGITTLQITTLNGVSDVALGGIEVAVPAPAAGGLLLLGLAGMFWGRRRRR